jgi:hypothetical protein
MYWITGILGIVLAGSPFIFGYSGDFYAMATSLAVGGVLLALSALEGYAKDNQRWEYWLAGVLGIGLIFAPFVLGFSTIAAAFWTSLIVGLGTVIVAGTKLFSDDLAHFE